MASACPLPGLDAVTPPPPDFLWYPLTGTESSGIHSGPCFCSTSQHEDAASRGSCRQSQLA